MIRFNVGDKVITKNGKKARITGISVSFYHVTCKDGEKIICGESWLKPRFPWKKFKKGKFAVHCKTEAEAKDFFKKLIEHNCEWINREKIETDETNWNIYRSNTCYDCDWYGIAYGLSYASYRYYEKECYKILEWSDYMDSKTKESTPEKPAKDLFKLEYLKRLKTAGFEWVTRDLDDTAVWAYATKPCKDDESWSLGGEYVKIPKRIADFPEIQWTDEEPTLINNLIVKYGGE